MLMSRPMQYTSTSLQGGRNMSQRRPRNPPRSNQTTASAKVAADNKTQNTADDYEYPSPTTWADIAQHPQWSDIVKYTSPYLTADDVKSLRLTGCKVMQLIDPSLTTHLSLRMDRAPLFSSDTELCEDQARLWLDNRRRLVIKNIDTDICPERVEYLISHGYLDTISQLIIFDCHAHGSILSKLAKLPNLESLVLADLEGDNQEDTLEKLEDTISCIDNMSSLKQLDIELDCTVHGSRLSFLPNLTGLEQLRLRGFDLSYGIHYLEALTSLTYLHFCHGNFYSSPSDDVNERDLLCLMGMTENLEHVHLEGFDCLSDVGLRPFCTGRSSVKQLVLKHCQEMSEDCLPCIGRMMHLNSLHIVHSEYDDTPTFERENLQHLNGLVSLKSLSLFYVLDDLSDLSGLRGLSTSLETLNIAIEDDVDLDDVDSLCQSIIIPTFTSLRKLRIFAEDGIEQTCQCGQLEVELASYNFGDLVYLE